MSLLLLFSSRAGTAQAVVQTLALSLPSPTLVLGEVLLRPAPQVLGLTVPMPTRSEGLQADVSTLALSLPAPALVHTVGAVLRPSPQVLAFSGGTPGVSIDVTIPIFTIGGVIRTDILRKSVSISDQLDEAPNTCQFTIAGGAKPIVGQEVVIGIGSLNNREFAGHLTSVQQTYEGLRSVIRWQCECIDYTRLLDRRRVYAHYPSQSATAIVIDLVQRFTSGFDTTHVQTGLPVIDAIDFTWEEPTQALTRLAKLVGGYWYADYARSVHFFVSETADAPADITDAQLEVRALAQGADLTQIRTRVYVEGYGSNAAVDVAPGSPVLPVEDAVFYHDGSVPGGGWDDNGWGVVTSGPQRIAYLGKTPGGGSSIVSGLDGPATAPYAYQSGGGGGVIGTVYYRVSFKSAAGETLPGAISNPAFGVAFPAPTTGPNVQGYGAGPLVGWHRYRVAYVTAQGETLAGDGYGQFNATPHPSPTAPALSWPSGYPIGPLVGTYYYCATYVTARGETLAGGYAQRNCYALGSQFSSYHIGTPGAGQAANVWGGLKPGSYAYAVTWVTPYGETTIGPAVSAAITSWTPGYPTLNSYGSQPSGQPGLPAGYAYHWAVALVDQDGGVSYLSSNSPTLTVTGTPAYCVINIPIGPPGTVARRIYRKVITDSSWRWVGDVQDNLSTIYSDFNPVVGAAWNGGGTMGGVAQVIVGGCPGGVTQIRVYRTKRNTSGPYYLIAELPPSSGNQAIADEAADNALTDYAPTANTAGGEALSISLPLGPAGTLAIRLYRTLAGGGDLKLLHEFRNQSGQAYIDVTPDSALTGAAPPLESTAGGQGALLTNIPIGPDGTLARRVYRARMIDQFNFGEYQFVAQLSNNSIQSLIDTAEEGTGEPSPLMSDAGASIVQLVNIPIGPAGVTARRIYRTMAGGGVFYFLAEIEDNATTGFVDDRSDKELGAVAGDTATLGALPGDSVLHVASTAAFWAGGGWVRAGNQTIAYSAIGDHMLTGIPVKPAGAAPDDPYPTGAISAPIRAGDDVIAIPMLLNVPTSGDFSILYAINKGDSVNVLIKREDAAAQAALASVEGGDGIHEHFLQDGRLSIASCVDRGLAELAAFAHAEQRLTFTSRDPKLRSGKTITVNLGAPTNIAGTFKLQSIVIDGFDIPGQLPLRHVTASSQLFSLEHLLRRVLMANVDVRVN